MAIRQLASGLPITQQPATTQSSPSPAPAPVAPPAAMFDLGSMMSLFMQIEQLKMVMSLFQGL